MFLFIAFNKFINDIKNVKQYWFLTNLTFRLSIVCYTMKITIEYIRIYFQQMNEFSIKKLF